MLRAQAASLWMEDLGCISSWGSTLSRPASMAAWVWRSVPVTMFPTVRREGVCKDKARSVTEYWKVTTTARPVPSQTLVVLRWWKPVNNEYIHDPSLIQCRDGCFCFFKALADFPIVWLKWDRGQGVLLSGNDAVPFIALD